MPGTTRKKISKKISNRWGGVTSAELYSLSSSGTYDRNVTSEFYSGSLLEKGPPYYNFLSTVEPSVSAAR